MTMRRNGKFFNICASLSSLTQSFASSWLNFLLCRLQIF
jgi:hypothetical protein